jgi:parallel beta helix pectate lyase-like protein
MKRSIGFSLSGLIALAGAAGAATFTVTETTDLIDPMPGNGFCNVFPQAGPGPCTLRAAIIEANALAGADTISIPGGLPSGNVFTLSIEGRGEEAAFTGDLDITESATIIFFASGPSPVIDANGIDRVFDIRTDSGTVNLLGLEITGGDANQPGDAAGGGIAVGFGDADVNISFCVLRGNVATFGGGLYNDGSNTDVFGCEIHDNEEADGGGSGEGSGIRNRGNLLVEASAIYANFHAGESGSAAVSSAPPFSGEPVLELRNSTVSGNDGAGVVVEGTALTLRNSTIVANFLGVAAASDMSGLPVVFKSSIIALNANADCNLSAAADFNTNSYNLDSDDSCGLADGSTNYSGVDPLLSLLGNFGGPTPTHRPYIDSPLIDAGHPAITAVGCTDEDQRFVERPIDYDGNGNARCDVGAVELETDVIYFSEFERLAEPVITL